MADDREDIHSDIVEFLGRELNDGLAAAIGDGLTRDGLLEMIVELARSGKFRDEYSDEELAHLSALLSRQPPFRLEREGDGSVHLVLTLGERRVQTWTPAVRNTVDAEVIALLGESLKNLVRHGSGPTGPLARTDAPETEPRALAGPGEAAVSERVRRAVGYWRGRFGASNALTERIGAGKNRDEILEMALPRLPEQAQAVLAEKLNEQPPFRVVCGADGGVGLELIVSGERVHIWTPKELGVSPPVSWRKVAYLACGGWFVFVVLNILVDWVSRPLRADDAVNGLVFGAVPLALYATLDGHRILVRKMGRRAAWRAYWAVAVLWVVVYAILQSNVALQVALAMAISRFGYLLVWIKLVYPFTRGRDVLQCPNCGALTTHRAWSKAMIDSVYRCEGCGTMAAPDRTGRRASIFGTID